MQKLMKTPWQGPWEVKIFRVSPYLPDIGEKEEFLIQVGSTEKGFWFSVDIGNSDNLQRFAEGHLCKKHITIFRSCLGRVEQKIKELGKKAWPKDQSRAYQCVDESEHPQIARPFEVRFPEGMSLSEVPDYIQSYLRKDQWGIRVTSLGVNLGTEDYGWAKVGQKVSIQAMVGPSCEHWRASTQFRTGGDLRRFVEGHSTPNTLEIFELWMTKLDDNIEGWRKKPLPEGDSPIVYVDYLGSDHPSPPFTVQISKGTDLVDGSYIDQYVDEKWVEEQRAMGNQNACMVTHQLWLERLATALVNKAQIQFEPYERLGGESFGEDLKGQFKASKFSTDRFEVLNRIFQERGVEVRVEEGPHKCLSKKHVCGCGFKVNLIHDGKVSEIRLLGNNSGYEFVETAQ